MPAAAFPQMFGGGGGSAGLQGLLPLVSALLQQQQTQGQQQQGPPGFAQANPITINPSQWLGTMTPQTQNPTQQGQGQAGSVPGLLQGIGSNAIMYNGQNHLPSLPQFGLPNIFSQPQQPQVSTQPVAQRPEMPAQPSPIARGLGGGLFARMRNEM